MPQKKKKTPAKKKPNLSKQWIRPKSEKSPLPHEHYQHPDAFGDWMGYEAVHADWKKHEVETRLVIREEHLSPAARVHGGVVSAFFDYSCGAAVFTSMGPKDLTSTIELKVNYLRPLNLGDELRAKARVVFRGKRLAVAQATLYRHGDPDPVAIATATFYVLSSDAKK